MSPHVEAILGALPATPPLPRDLQYSLLVMGMALEIADEAARADIESNCTAFAPVADIRWYDTSAEGQVDDAFLNATVPRSLMYLELRLLVVRHEMQPHLVRFVEPA